MQGVVFVGVQGAGKSSFYQERFFHTHLRINLDMLKGSRFREDILLRAAIEAKQPFVVDNTNPTREARYKYIDQARQARFKLQAYYFDVSFEDAMLRNSQRDEAQRVSAVGLKSVLKLLQMPTCEEGFDEVYRVRVSAAGFSVARVE